MESTEGRCVGSTTKHEPAWDQAQGKWLVREFEGQPLVLLACLGRTGKLLEFQT